MSPGFIKATPQRVRTGGPVRSGNDDPFAGNQAGAAQPETDQSLDPVSATSTTTTTGSAPAPTTDGSPVVTWASLTTKDPTALGPVSGAPGAPINTIRRGEKVTGSYGAVPAGDPNTWGNAAPGTQRTYSQQQQVGADAYSAEYWEKTLADPVKKQWLANRAIALGFAKYDSTSQYGVSEKDFISGGVASMWEWAGSVVRANHTLNTLTPEQYMDLRYKDAGGDDALAAAKKAAAPPNPIQTQTQTSTYTMSRAQVDAAADQIAQRLLGHMASDAEMKKARGVMNGILKANPTVSTTTTDRTNPDAITSSTHTKGGASPSDAADAYAMKVQRGSEGMAFNVGKLMEEAMTKLDQGL